MLLVSINPPLEIKRRVGKHIEARGGVPDRHQTDSHVFLHFTHLKPEGTDLPSALTQRGIVCLELRSIIGELEDLIMTQRLALLLAVTATMVTGAGWGGASPAARILEIKGKAMVVEAKDLDRPAAVYGTIYADERIVVEKNSQVTLGFPW